MSVLFQPHPPSSARISSDVKGLDLLPAFCSERDLFHMVNLTTAVWVFSPPTKHPRRLALGSLSCSNNNFWSFFNVICGSEIQIKEPRSLFYTAGHFHDTECVSF